MLDNNVDHFIFSPGGTGISMTYPWDIRKYIPILVPWTSLECAYVPTRDIQQEFPRNILCIIKRIFDVRPWDVWGYTVSVELIYVYSFLPKGIYYMALYTLFPINNKTTFSSFPHREINLYLNNLKIRTTITFK